MRIVVACSLLFLMSRASAQVNLYDQVNEKRERIARSGTVVLGGWALANLGSGLIGQANSTGARQQFYRSNTIWGGVNLAIAGVGYISSRRKKIQSLSAAESFKKQGNIEKLFLFNAGLDLAYVAYGFYRKERALRYTGEKKDRLTGAGNSLLLQGGFLTLFDGVLYFLHQKNGRRLMPKLENLSLSAGNNGIGLTYHF